MFQWFIVSFYQFNFWEYVLFLLIRVFPFRGCLLPPNPTLWLESNYPGKWLPIFSIPWLLYFIPNPPTAKDSIYCLLSLTDFLIVLAALMPFIYFGFIPEILLIPTDIYFPAPIEIYFLIPSENYFPIPRDMFLCYFAFIGSNNEFIAFFFYKI